MFTTADALQEKVDEYFEWIKGEIDPITSAPGVMIPGPAWKRKPEPPTITGLTLFLGFESRQSFFDYRADEEFSYTIKKARLRIESEYEKALHASACTGSIFALKNMGWTDKQESEQKVTFKDERIDPSKLTDEELRTLAEIQRRSGTRPA